MGGHWKLVLLILVLSAIDASRVLAQARVVLPGERIRITSARSWTGVVAGTTTDSISILPEGGRDPLTFALGSIERLEVAAGRRSRPRGFLIGGGIGGAAGLLLGALAKGDDCGVDAEDDLLGISAGVCDVAGDVAMLSLPIVGILVGGGIGALANGGERWERVGMSTEARVVASTRGRIGMFFRFRRAMPYVQ
jgi:hypothetical protein